MSTVLFNYSNCSKIKEVDLSFMQLHHLGRTQKEKYKLKWLNNKSPGLSPYFLYIMKEI